MPAVGRNAGQAAVRLCWLVAALALLLVGLRLALMAAVPLMDTTEARYGDIGRRMLESGNLVTPWFNDGVPFWGKPPLSFWLTAASFRLFGVGEFSARLPHFLCAAAIVALVWQMALRRSRREAAIAALLLGGCAGMYVGGAGVMTDPSLVLGTTLAMAGFWRAMHAVEDDDRLRGHAMLFGGLALGLLAKGPLALVLAMPPIAGWALLSRRVPAAWRGIAWVRGLLLTLAIAAPWYVLAEMRTPGFLEYFLAGEHFQRFLTPGWRGDLYGSAHREPIGMIWAFGLAAVLPWPLVLWSRQRDRQPTLPADAPWRLYLLLWAVWPLVFFTAARNIIWPYVMPALPAAALLAAAWVARLAPEAIWRRVAVGLALLVLISGGLLVEAKRSTDRSTRELVGAWRAQRAAGEGLAFAGWRPFSASFYGAGEPVAEPDVEAAIRRVGPGGFVAVKTGHFAQSVADAVARRETVLVGRFSGHDLFRVASRGRP